MSRQPHTRIALTEQPVDNLQYSCKPIASWQYQTEQLTAVHLIQFGFRHHAHNSMYILGIYLMQLFWLYMCYILVWYKEKIKNNIQIQNNQKAVVHSGFIIVEQYES